MSTVAPSRDVSSWRTTVSAPSGIGAPVMIRIAVPATCALGHRPGARFADDREADRRRRRRVRDVARAHRVSVHRGVVEAWKIGSRRDRLGEDPSERLVEADRLRREHADLLEQTPLRAGD